MLPKFPTFKKFQIEDKGHLEKIIKEFPAYGEYSLVSLLTWYNIEVSTYNNNLILRMNDYFSDNTPAYSLFGTTNIDDAIEVVLFHAKSLGHESELIFLPEPVINALKAPQKFIYKEDRDRFDYILSIEKMYNPRGDRGRKERKVVNFYANSSSEYKAMEIDLKNEKCLKDIHDLYEAWRKNKKKAKNHLDFEYDDLVNLSQYYQQLDLVSFGIYYNDLLISYALIELSHNSYALIHYQKSNTSYPKITVYLFNLLGKYLLDKGYKFLNIEADLGVPGLRNAKTLRHPVQLLKKYNLRLK